MTSTVTRYGSAAVVGSASVSTNETIYIFGSFDIIGTSAIEITAIVQVILDEALDIVASASVDFTGRVNPDSSAAPRVLTLASDERAYTLDSETRELEVT